MVCKQISDDAMESMWSRLLSDFPKILGKIWLWLSALMNKINWKAKIFVTEFKCERANENWFCFKFLTKFHWLLFIWSVVFHESIGSERLIDASKLFFLFSNNSTFFLQSLYLNATCIEAKSQRIHFVGIFIFDFFCCGCFHFDGQDTCC